MILQNNRQTVTGINNLVVDNNPISVISCLKTANVTLNDNLRGTLVSALELLFDTNKPKWIEVIKCIQYDPNVNNYTTSIDVLANLKDTYSSQYGISDISASRFDIGGIFKGIGDFIGGTSTSGGGVSQTESKPVISQTAAIVITLVGIIIVAIIAFRK